MQKKTIKLIIILGVCAIVVAAVITGLVMMSHGTLKIAVNIPADTIKVMNSKNEIKFQVFGQKEAEISTISSGTYTVEILATGYQTEKKEVKIGWMSTVSESFALQIDTLTARNELAEAENILLGNWTGKLGKSTLTLQLDEVKPGSVYGNDLADGKQRKLRGTYQKKGELLDLSLNEPGDQKEDGQFILAVNKATQTAEGTWESFDKSMKYPVKFVKEAGQAPVNKNTVASNTQETVTVQKQSPLLRILRATYGTVWKTYNVTTLLNNRIHNDNIYVEVSNKTFGDPDRGKPKSLNVSYEYKGNTYNKNYRENSIFRVP